MTRRKSAWLIGSAASVWLTVPAYAQTSAATQEATSVHTTAEADTDTPQAPAAAVLTGPRASTDVADSDKDFKDIVVTGTRIVRPNMTSNAPVTVIDQTYLKERGLARIEDALSQLPQVTPILGLQQSTWTSGKAPVGLRNLGSGRTLTLLNGQRMDNDINLVPGALIDRIDIMTGGASAVYGSDAIAGVINFILKRKFDGIAFDGEISGVEHANNDPLLRSIAEQAGYPTPTGNYLGGGNYYASLTAGKTFLDGHVNITVFGTYKRADPIRFSDLDTTNCPLLMFDPNNPDAGNKTWACSTTTYNKYNYFSINGQDLSNARDGSRSFRPYETADEGRGIQSDLLQRRNEAVNAGGFVNIDLPAGLRLDGSFLYDQSVDRGAVSLDAAFYNGAAQVNCDNPFLGRSQAQALCGDAAGTNALSDPIAIALWRPGFTQTMRFTTSDWRGSLGLSGTIVDKIRFQLSYQQSRNINRGTSDNIYLYDLNDRIERGLQVRNVAGVPTCLSKINGTDPTCQPIDAFSSNSQISDAVYGWLTGTGRQFQQSDLQVANAVVSGTLEDYGIRSPLAKSGIGFAVSGEYRKYRQQSAGYDAWSNFTTYDGRTSVRELGGEIDIPLIEDKPFSKSLSINGGYRISDYDVYDRLVRSWKAEASWAPVDGLRFRASYNRAVRVGVQQRLEGQNRYPNTLALDLCAPPRGSTVQRYTFAQCASGGMTRTQYDALTSYTGCNSQGFCPTTLINGGNPDLQPERSRSKTLGVVFQPKIVPGFSATVDWYDIDIKAAFQYARWSLAFNQCYDSQVQFFCSLYHRDPQTGQVIEIDARYNNSGYTATRGIDFATTYAIEPKRFGVNGNVGTFSLNFNGSLTTKFNNQFAPNTTAWSCLGYYGFVCGNPSPRWRHVAGFNWQLPWVKGGVGFTWRYIGATEISKLSSNSVLAARSGENYPLASRITPYSYFDLSANLTLVKGLDIRGSVQNLLDKDPPLIGYDTTYGTGQLFNTYPSYYIVRGRTLKIGLSARL